MTKPKPFIETTPAQVSEACSHNKGSCATGGCGGPGLCPGIALLIAYVTGTAITLLSGLTWLGWAIGAPTALILLTGAWRFVPRHSSK